jgi:hypothetical protein
MYAVAGRQHQRMHVVTCTSCERRPTILACAKFAKLFVQHSNGVQAYQTFVRPRPSKVQILSSEPIERGAERTAHQVSSLYILYRSAYTVQLYVRKQVLQVSVCALALLEREQVDLPCNLTV